MIIRTESDRNQFIKKLVDIDLDKQAWDVSAKPYKQSRSLNQNALAAIWYRERGKQTANGEQFERCQCKLLYGVPILMSDPVFAEAWEPYQLMPYDRQLSAMRIVDVTSIMNTEQMAEYLEAVERASAEQGIGLTPPNPLARSCR
jgi:hypothetical protein